jgi:hypothetical protein
MIRRYLDGIRQESQRREQKRQQRKRQRDELLARYVERLRQESESREIPAAVWRPPAHANPFTNPLNLN